MNLSNLQRDMFHQNMNQNSLITYGSTNPIGSTMIANTTGTVESEFASRHTFDSATNSSGNWCSFGAYLAQPWNINDWEPYRVRAYIGGPKEKYVVLGYGPAAPGGTDDAIINVKPFPIDDSGWFDEVIRIKVDGANSDRPIFIGVAIGESTGGIALANISCQKMAVAAPTFSSSSS